MDATVIRVTDTEFELSDGRIYQHVEKLDYAPSVEEFQETYMKWFTIFKREGFINE